MELTRGGRIRWPLLLGVIALGVLDVASGDSSEPGTTDLAPFVSIRQPGDLSIVRTASFEIGGGLAGSVTTIGVAIDGQDLGRATRTEGDFDWRIDASRVSVAPGFHEITVTGTGPGGSDVKTHRVLYDPDVAFEIIIDPNAVTYDAAAIPFDPPDADILLLGPDGEDVRMTLSAAAPPQIDASVTNLERDTGSTIPLFVDSVEPVAGVYEVVVTAVGPAGTTPRQATYTITITESAAAPTTAALAPGAIRDDFEGADLWTFDVTSSTNGADASAEIAEGGNPGGFREMRHTLPGTVDGEGNPTQITVVHTFTGGGWDPATDGALSSIRYSEDQIVLDPPFDGAAVGTLFLVFQDNATYSAPINDNNAYTSTTWETVTETLGPGDFSPAPGPDFSASGGPMTFGILRSNTSRGSSEIVVTHGIDNWTVELLGE